jgi:nucleotide-binding universal stress UspA family protein
VHESTMAVTSVVVGIDGSTDSLRAVRWAAADAACRHRPLHLVHALEWPKLAYPPVGLALPVSYDAQTREAAARILNEAAVVAREAAPAVRITTAIATETPVPALLDASRHAAEVVVGSRGNGGFAALQVGATSAQLAAHAVCPVVIVRGSGATDGPNAGRVVVGVDGSHGAAEALGFAFEQASFRGIGLTVVHAYRWPAGTDPGDMLPIVFDHDDLRDDQQRALAESLASWREKYPDVDVRLDTASGRAAGVLVDASTGATLLVVGARGHGGFVGLLLGSVSQTVIQHAACPVAVVHRHNG